MGLLLTNWRAFLERQKGKQDAGGTTTEQGEKNKGFKIIAGAAHKREA